MSYATPAAVVILGLVSVLAPLMDSRQRQLDTGTIEGRITFAGPPPPPTIVIQDGGSQQVLYVDRSGGSATP